MNTVALDRHIALSHHLLRAGLAMIGFAIALVVTLLSSSFEVSLVGAAGLFFSGMVVGYQAARIGQAVAGKLPAKNSGQA